MNPLGGFGRDITEIASLFIGVAVIGLLLTNSGGFSKDVGAVSAGFSGILSTATFQRNNYSAPFAF